jgi:hypothetical protein
MLTVEMLSRHTTKRVLVVSIMMMVMGVFLACGSIENTPKSYDAEGDVRTSMPTDVRAELGPRCCEPSPFPLCEMMHFGGWSRDGLCGEDEYDGLPVPSDPGWMLVKDFHGCPMWTMWTNPHDGLHSGEGGLATAYCGGAPSSDASHD